MHKVCHISSVHPAFDTRIFYKECKTLAKAVYEVYFIVTYQKEEIIDGVYIIPLPERNGRFYRFFVKDWLALFKAIKVNADIYHFHDPELIFVGLILKLFRKKVVYDVHEDVSKQILSKEWIGNFFIRKLAATVFNAFEQFSVFFFNGIVAATDDIAKKFGSSKTILLRNFPILELIDSVKPINAKKIKQVIIYAGGLTRIRGIKEIIQAMEYLDDKAELWLLGKWESKEFEKECRSLEGWQYTKYLGFKKLEEVYGYMKRSNIGVATLYPVENYLTGLPVKAFEYMSCDLPIVMSSFPYWEKIFKYCAIFVDPQNPKDIAERINILLENKDLGAKLGKAGRILVENNYSWESESKKLLNLYEELSK
jgi:glycosyltransferase involved in cell wall biosynthesis